MECQAGAVDAIGEWCERELGARPVARLLEAGQMSRVAGVRLDDGRCVVVKSRPDERGRARACVAVQLALAERGFPCARPLTGVTLNGGFATHAEEWRPGGEVARGDDPATAARFAALLAELMAGAAAQRVAPPLPNPAWVRWDEPAPDGEPDAAVGEIARRVRARLAAAALPSVVGHADWETQNLRWHGTEPYAVHDWDSLAWLPEAAIAGAACGAFASDSVPTLAPLDSSAAFLAAYEDARGRPFSRQEREVAWAASLSPAVHNARGELLHGSPPVALAALQAQAGERLARAGA
jgi:hypothetical protein